MKILLVDDQLDLLELLSEEGEDFGYSCIISTSPEEALKLLESQNDFDVIISDEKMPEMSGSVLLSKVREIKPEVKRILAGGSLEEVEIEEGAAEFLLPKPYDFDDITEILKKVGK